MLKKNNINLKGFTIIEVVLVLAIAALIIAGVFIALPNLQNAQKDTNQKQAVLTVMTKMLAAYGENNKAWLGAGSSNACAYNGVVEGVKYNNASLTCDKQWNGTLTTATDIPDSPAITLVLGAYKFKIDGTKYKVEADSGNDGVSILAKLETGSYYLIKQKP